MPDARHDPTRDGPAGATAQPGSRTWLAARLAQARRALERETVRADDAHKMAQWLQAELENVRKEPQRESARAGAAATEAFARRLLPALDSLDAAVVRASPDASPAADGVRLVRDQLLSALAAEGLEPIVAAGAPFDPHLHEAVGHVSRPGAPAGPPIVEAELRRGYRFRGRVLRAALVRVAEPAESPGPETSSHGA